jgi:hypothetical protein
MVTVAADDRNKEMESIAASALISRNYVALTVTSV